VLEQRLLQVYALLLAAGLLEGGGRCIARVLGLGTHQRCRDTQPRAALTGVPFDASRMTQTPVAA